MGNRYWSKDRKNKAIDVRSFMSSLAVMYIFLALCFCLLFLVGCRTTRKYEENTQQTVHQNDKSHQEDSAFFFRIDSFLRAWSVQMDGFEADISIPLQIHSDNTATPDTTDQCTTPQAPSKKTQAPCIGIHLRANSLNATGEHKGIVQEEVTNSSKLDKNSSSERNTNHEKKKKTTRRPAFWWWVGTGVFLLIVIYLVWRWLKKG